MPTVSVGQSMSNCGHTPRLRRTSRISVAMSRPSMVAVPDVGGIMPVSMPIVVVLPAPLWPKRHEISPRQNCSERPLTAVKWPNCFVRPRTFTLT